MMIRRKREHKSFVRDCNLFIQGKCRYEGEFCWFNHSEIVIEEDEGDDKQSSDSFFRNAQENQEPPIEEEEEEAQE
jgi:hypothetical protein